MAPYRAVIFDMDGVLADSEPLYLQGINDILEPYGVHISPGENTDIMGTTVEVTWQRVIAKFGLPPDSYDECVAAYDRTMERLLRRARGPLPGARELLAELKRRGVPFALASSALTNWIESALQAIELDGSFAAIVSRSMVKRGKPAPDIYLHAAEKLGIPPRQCIALEDTPPGLASAKAAGMLAVQVRGSSTPFPPLPDADLVLDSLEDFPLSLLE